MRQLLSIFDLMTIIVIILIKLPAVRCFPLTHSHSPLPSYCSPCLPPLIVFLSSFGLANALLFATFVSRLKNKKKKEETQRKPLDIYAFLWLMNFLGHASLGTAALFSIFVLCKGGRGSRLGGLAGFACARKTSAAIRVVYFWAA